MRSLLSLVLVSLLCTCIPGVAHAQIRLSARINPSPSIICLDQMAEYQIILENCTDRPELRPPHFKHFMVMGSASTTEGVSSINGQVTHYKAWVFTLRPLKKGIFRIDPTRAVIGGKSYVTEAVTIEVKNCQASTAAGSVPSSSQSGGRENLQDMMIRNGEDPVAKAKENLALVLDVDRRSCFVGEPVEVKYTLLSRLHCESKINKQPSFNGFSVIDLPTPGDFGSTYRQYRGKSFNEYTLRRSQAYPLQAGNIEIEPAEIGNEVSFVKEDFIKQQGMSDWIDEYSLPMLPREAIVTRTVNVSNEPVVITVKPLPEKDRPASFDGAVGQFIFEASVRKNRFALNETGLMTLVIRGKGNMTLLTPPVIQWPAGLDAFEPKSRDELDKTTVPVSGRKVLEIAFSAQKEGQYTIPPIRFSYFDPVTATYQELETKSFPITVDPADPSLLNTTEPEQREKLSFINRIFYHRWWIILFVAAIILSGLLFWIWREKKQADASREKSTQQEPEPIVDEPIISVSEPMQHPLKGSADCLEREDLSSFYAVLNKEFREQLCRRFSLEPSQCNSVNLPELLDQRAVPLPVALKTQALLQKLGQILYSPMRDDAQARVLYDEAWELIQQWES